MKKLFDLPQECFIEFEMDLLDAFLFSYLNSHSDFFQSIYMPMVPANKRDGLLTHISFLNLKRRGLDQRIQALNKKMLYLYHTFSIEKQYKNAKDFDIFGYPVSVMEWHQLDLKDMLILHWVNESTYSSTLYHKRVRGQVYTYLNYHLFTSDYPILKISRSGLRNRIHTLIEKGLLDRMIEYSDNEKVKRCYYRIVDEKLFQNSTVSVDDTISDTI